MTRVTNLACRYDKGPATPIALFRKKKRLTIPQLRVEVFEHTGRKWFRLFVNGYPAKDAMKLTRGDEIEVWTCKFRKLVVY